MSETGAVAAIATRDVLKFMRDPSRVVLSFLVPFLLIVLLAGTLQLNLGGAIRFNFTAFIFTGVLGMTIFQSSMQGVASLLEDRQNDFAQEMFVAPISRYAIVLGKILGEAMVAMTQTIPLVVLALALRVSVSPERLALVLIAAIAGCLLGGSVGLLALSVINTQQAANQLFNFVLLPQLFLAGVFSPINRLPWYLEILSLLSPLRYVVDLLRGVLYFGSPAYSQVVLFPPLVNLSIIGVMFAAFMVVGTALFVRRETNR
jgi:ABC-2 type transport system permease protein